MTQIRSIVGYPAILSNAGNPKDVYTVTFPDVPGAISQGRGISEAIYNGSEALGLMLYDEKELPASSKLDEVQRDHPNDFVTVIAVDLEQTKKNVRKPLVKKNTTIPGDLAQKAEEAGINFSKTLTEALEIKLSSQA